MGPRDMESRTNLSGLHHQPSAKQLISRYESMDSPPVPSRRVSRTLAIKQSFLLPSKKDKSPGRHSFLNLMGLFKKGNNKLNTFRSSRSPSPIPLDFEFEPAQETRPASPISLGRPPALFSGPLLYLSRASESPSSSPILPVWTTCTATLEADHIVISWLTAHGNPDVHSVSLAHCTDVRSLTPSQLDADERALLPRDGDTEERFFEMLFEGRSREKFAASSVRDRASWVNAIWEAILPSQGPKPPCGDPTDAVEEIPGSWLFRRESVPAPVSCVAPTKLNSQERSLPPIPLDSIPFKSSLSVRTSNIPNLSRHNSQISPSVYPVSRLASPASSVNSQPRSPSIANLSQRSMVKSRLAELERSNSQASSGTGSATSPHSPHRSKSPLSPRARRAHKNLPTLADMGRIRSAASAGVDSILDAYRDETPVQSRFREPPMLRPITLTDPGPVSAHPAVAPVNELLRDQQNTLENQSHSLPEQIMFLQQDLQKRPSGNSEPLLIRLQDTVTGIDRQMEGTGTALKSIRAKLEEVSENVKSNSTSENGHGNAEMLQSLEAVRSLITTNVPEIMSRLETLKEDRPKDGSVFTRLSNIAASVVTAKESEGVLDASSGQTELREILAILKEDGTAKAVQAQQQTDTVRYLNELNAWLEAFVNNGTSQIQTMSESVQILCKELGCATADGHYSESGGLLVDIRRLAQEIDAREHRAAALQNTVNNLSSGTGAGAAPQSIAALIERQRQDHEGLLRALTTDLSNEIRGERLRFVEAMKEATAINVQIHVEEFKKELKREVQGMTQEIGHLYKERQTIENQIADLFAFYSKQKTGGLVPSVPPGAIMQQHPQSQGFDQYHDLQRRQLPSPQKRQKPIY